MSDLRATPGPWVATDVYRDEIGWPSVDVMAQGWQECPVAVVHGRSDEEAMANAHLVRAVHALVEACEVALEAIRGANAVSPRQAFAAAKLRDALRMARGGAT